jgi:hypothetical protein
VLRVVLLVVSTIRSSTATVYYCIVDIDKGAPDTTVPAKLDVTIVPVWHSWLELVFTNRVGVGSKPSFFALMVPSLVSTGGKLARRLACVSEG